MVPSPTGLGPGNKCAGEGQQQIINDRPVLSSERVLYKDYDRRCSLEKKNLAVSFKGLDIKTN
jgi:hypothetical protein